MTISPRLLRALGAGGVCFAVGATGSILLGGPWVGSSGYSDEHGRRRLRWALHEKDLTPACLLVNVCCGCTLMLIGATADSLLVLWF